MQALDELRTLIDHLNADEIEYALCGGLAVIVYGYVRATKDIDLLVRKDDLDNIKKTVEKCGFTIESGLITFKSGTKYKRDIYRLLKVIGVDIFMLDLIFVEPFLEDVWDDRETIEWEGRRMQIVSPKGLFEMKRSTGRTQDIADLEELGYLKNEIQSEPQDS